MKRTLSTLLAATGLTILSGIASAQMQDTWDINAPNGTPMQLGQPLPVPARAVASGPMQDTWDINAPNGAPLRSAEPAATNRHTAAHGHAANAASAQRVIEIAPGMKAVNVRDGETVLFKAGGESFAWTFEPTLLHASFGLADIAPAGMDVRGVQVYCEPTPYERAG
jgi:hypothetical protein